MGMLLHRRDWGNLVPTKKKEPHKEVSTNNGKPKTRKIKSADLPGNGK